MLRIAIIDDSDDIRLLLRHELERSVDFEVCADGRDGFVAIDIARDLRPDVMLLDLSMPGMDGLAALPLILEQSPATRVIMHSGFGKDQIADQARALGATACLEKRLGRGPLSQRLLDALTPTP